MKKYIVKRIKEVIEELGEKWAANWVAKMEHSSILPITPESQKQIDAAEFNMKKAEEKIAWYKELLKDQEK